MLVVVWLGLLPQMFAVVHTAVAVAGVGVVVELGVVWFLGLEAGGGGAVGGAVRGLPGLLLLLQPVVVQRVPLDQAPELGNIKNAAAPWLAALLADFRRLARLGFRLRFGFWCREGLR